MSRVTVWKCDATGKLFEDQKKYQAHLRQLATERRTRRRLQIQEQETDAWWAAAYNIEQSISEWAQFVIDNQDRFWAEAAARYGSYNWAHVGKKIGRRKDAVVMPVPRLLEFTEFQLHWQNSVSNSHSCPHNGVTCWSREEARDGRPTGYPGWTGRVAWIVEWPKCYDGHYLGSDLFRSAGRYGRVRAHTGTGGGGGMHYNEKHGCHVQSYAYDFRLFAADWPGLARHYAAEQMLDVLSGNRARLAAEELSSVDERF